MVPMIEIIELIRKLKSERLKQNTTLEKIASRTNVSLLLLKRIENCDDINSISKIYLRAHLVKYAEYLKSGDILDEIDRLLPPKKENIKPVTKKISTENDDEHHTHITPTSPHPIDPKTYPLKKIIKVVLIIAASTFVLKACISIRNRTVAAVTKHQLINAQKKNNVKQKPQPKITQVKHVESEDAAAEQQTSQVFSTSAPNARIITKSNVFVQVKADGRLIFKSILLKGAREVWKADESLEIKISNPSEVLLEIMGKQIQTRNSKKQVTYKITPSGFKTDK